MRSVLWFVVGFTLGGVVVYSYFWNARQTAAAVPVPTVEASAAPPPKARVVEPVPRTEAPALDHAPLAMPIAGLTATELRDSYSEMHNGHVHEAIDIMKPRGTPILAVADGTIRKLFLSKPGGNTIYEFDSDDTYCYYYAHLDRYADGLREGQQVKRGEVIGYVGSTGDARPDAPHLHFGILKLNGDRHWWEGKWLNPYPALAKSLSAR